MDWRQWALKLVRYEGDLAHEPTNDDLQKRIETLARTPQPSPASGQVTRARDRAPT